MGWGEGQGEYKPHFHLTDGIWSTGVYRGCFLISSPPHFLRLFLNCKATVVERAWISDYV